MARSTFEQCLVGHIHISSWPAQHTTEEVGATTFAIFTSEPNFRMRICTAPERLRLGLREPA